MTKQSKVFMSLLSAASLSCIAALAPVLAQDTRSLQSHIKRERSDSLTAPSVLNAEVDTEKSKIQAAYVRGAALLAKERAHVVKKKHKTSCDDDQEVPEFFLQHLLEKSLKEQGVKVVDQDGPAVCNFSLYVGIDDDDDDDDGIPDAEDKDEFGDADDVVGAKNTDLPDSQLIDVDLDQFAPEVTESLPDTQQDKGLFILLVADNPDQVMVFRLKADALEKEEATCSAAKPNLGNLFKLAASFGKLIMSQRRH